MMRLWSIQPIENLHRLEEEGILYADGRRISPGRRYAYSWMRQQMIEKIGRCPVGERYPIWAWYQYRNSVHKMPDLRHSEHLLTGTAACRLTFDIPDDKVVLSEHTLWHNAINDSHLAWMHRRTGEIEEAELVLNEGLKTWSAVFDITDNQDSRSIQATFWGLPLSAVVKVEEFIAR